VKVKVKYVGKKKPFRATFRAVGEFVELNFDRPGAVAYIEEEVVAEILKHSPEGFIKPILDEEMQPVAEEVEEEDSPKEDMICPYCFRQYKDEKWYELHVEKCKGSVDE
jgi:hypothetical protein